MKQLLNQFFLEDSTKEDEISIITFVASLPPGVFSYEDIELFGKVLARTIFSTDNPNQITHFLKQCTSDKYVIISNYKVFVSNPRFFQILLINSLQNCHWLLSIKKNNLNNVKILQETIALILKCFHLIDNHSVYLLRTLKLILTKCSDILTPELSLKIVQSMNCLTLSPISGFKWHTQSITKICVKFLTKESVHQLLDLKMIPIRGIETYYLVNLFPNKYFINNITEASEKVLCSFQTNMTNKDGGIIYEKLLVLEFEEWKEIVWPLFLPHLQSVELEGEFFHSLLKYWIPMSVNVYQEDLYSFLRNEAIDFLLKAYLLLETRKKGFVRSNYATDILRMFHNVETTNLSLRLISLYHKQSLRPQNFEVDLVKKFLTHNLNLSLEYEEVKSLNMFFSQFFFYAHNDLSKTMESYEFYKGTLDDIHSFCCASLNTEFFEVGIQLWKVILDILTGSHQNLLLLYKLEKIHFYDKGRNVFYEKLKIENTWELYCITFQAKLQECMLQKGKCSETLTNLIVKHYPYECFLNVNNFKQIYAESKESATLKTVEKISHLSKVLLKDRTSSNVAYIHEIIDSMSMNILDCSSANIFENVLYLQIISTAINYKFKSKRLAAVIEKCFEYISRILDHSLVNSHVFHYPKTVEAFINTVINIVQNLDTFFEGLNKKPIINLLRKIIAISNMKKPVTVCAAGLKKLFLTMEENEHDKNYKIELMSCILKSLINEPTKCDIKIRRYPEYRLVIHALCSSEIDNPDGPLLNWAIRFLLDVIKGDMSSDLSLARSLHCIEILISESTLHNYTLPYIEEIVVQCVELFIKESWIIRNADLQLAKALIDRLFGVSLNVSNRPRSFEDLMMLFPNLSTYFFNILSANPLDERATMAFQFFLESQVKENPWKYGVTKWSTYFQLLFRDIIKTNSNGFGKLAARSLVALTKISDIPSVFVDVTNYIRVSYENMNCNILSNLVSLLQMLYEKYINIKKSSKQIDCCLRIFLDFLRQRNTEIYNFLLFKVEPACIIVDKILHFDGNCYQNRLWLNNYIPLLVNSNNFLHYLNHLLSGTIPNCQKAKVLSMLVSKLERNHVKSSDIPVLLNILFQNCFSEVNGYISSCYFKVILLLIPNINKPANIDMKISFHTLDLHRMLSYVLYLFITKKNVPTGFYGNASKLYIRHIGMNEETDSDIMASLLYFSEDVPIEFKVLLYKMVFYYSLNHSTYLKAYTFIVLKNKKTYCSMLAALWDFLSRNNIPKNLKQGTDMFYKEIMEYIDEEYEFCDKKDGFYTMESDKIVPKLFLQRIMDFC